MWGQHDLTDTENPPSVLMNERIAAFEEASGIEVIYEQVAWDQLAPRLALAVTSGGDVPDLVEAGSQHIPSLLDAGALQPLDDLLQEADWLADLNQIDEAACVHDDTRYCVSNLARSSLTYYRVDDFPTGFPSTAEGLLGAAESLPDDMFVTTFYAGREYAAVELTWGQWMYSNGGQIFDDEGRPAWVSPENIAVLEFGRELVTSGLIPEASLTGDFTTAEAFWIEGSAASLRGGTWSPLFVPNLEEQLTSGEVDIAGGLSFNGNPPSVFLNSENWVVPSGAANPAEAAAWIDGFMQPAFLDEWGQAQAGIPTLTTATASGAFEDAFYSDVQTIMQEQGRFIEQSPYYVESLNSLAIAIQEIMLDPEIDIEERLQQAEEEILTRYW
jgi:multiple sugar transport system substrate-binding protein